MPAVHVVILNYRRPANIAPIVATCLAVGAIERVRVIDQADPENRLDAHFASERVLMSQARNIGAGRRLSHAADLDCDLVLAIDDDLFLTANQIDALIAASLNDSSRVHGLWGQLIVEVAGAMGLQSGIFGVNRPVDILNRVYAFTPAQARKALDIARSLDLDPESLGPIDDILLSFGGAQRPMCHDLGPLRECPTSNQPGIAVWKQPGFEPIRIEVVRRIKQHGLAWRDSSGLGRP